MRKLIVNADDFGFNREITDAIVQCHKFGTVTSTTMMVNMPAVEYAVEKSKKYPNLSIGIHLNFTLGKPLSAPEKIPALIGADGNFKNQKEMFKLANRFQLPAEQIEREMCAQIEKFLSFGLTPSHSDSHHHIAACLQFFFLKLKILKRYGIKTLRTHRSFYHSDKTDPEKVKLALKAAEINLKTLPIRLAYEFEHLYAKMNGYKLPSSRFSLPRVISRHPLDYNIDGWRKFIANLPGGIVESTVHPGLPSEDPTDRLEYRQHRVVEYNLLTNPECKKIFQDNGVDLVSFRDV